MNTWPIGADGAAPNPDGGLTPSQTVGPFFGHALPFAGGPDLVPAHTPGAIRVHGTVYDGEGVPVPDAIVEFWQADAAGRIPQAQGSFARDGATFTGWGRCAVDRLGRYAFDTVKPGAVDADALPYIAVSVFARGMLRRVVTRMYFPEDTGRPEDPGGPEGADPAPTPAPARVGDPVFSVVPAARHETLIAVPEESGSYRFDVHIQGEKETVFFAV
ncbi:protocatechuate 3,4-dioxygenase subunit alpha [Streptomyces sp. SID3343]|uniref:protocatechuate 3,4-dioxygenase subunit alpha n=1 Tax=Streptomyces sp. SID3343 TaxID=2690260 RepID=UPI00136EA440|nr:protocatechuate 3,4-dioxygenase subunit alpha [Streptomyces sp. SID3343]MYW06525.1 protocatechuate 3,4-dioxygenase subunit alpha [Streptomyces sp. SID3343]